MTDKTLRLYNTLTRSKEDFAPIDPNNVRMYVCGPTVYDFAHIGNARPVIVFDVLFRLLRHLYGEDHVTYVRNITDVDDKINDRALRDFGPDIASGKLSLNEAIRRVTEKTATQFHDDVKALGCLPPTHEPRATEFVEPRPDGKTDMIGLIQNLIARGHAYEANGEVLFDISSMQDYGQLSKRPLDEQQAGARIAVDAHKKSPGDFVLWKLSSPEEPGWNSPWGRGRPGWHIECSAMSAAYLGEVFDIHGGGLDLIFPHHENEIAQSRCAHGTDVMANYWLHNGFLQVEGRKMSKSEGNFVTIYELLRTEKFGGRAWQGSVLRYAMLKTHYRQPIDWTVDGLRKAREELLSFSIAIGASIVKSRYLAQLERGQVIPIDEQIIAALCDDLNTPLLVARLHQMATDAQRDLNAAERLLAVMDFLGLISPEQISLLGSSYSVDTAVAGMLRRYDTETIVERIRVAIANNDDRTRDHLVQRIESWGVQVDLQSLVTIGAITINGLDPEAAKSSKGKIESAISERLAFIAKKNWAEADRIRAELLAQGIQLKDGKDPTTGERITTWEVKR